MEKVRVFNRMKRRYSLLVLLFIYSAIQAGERRPLKEVVENSARYRWENKVVIDNRLVDDMESDSTWHHPDLGTMDITNDKVYSGNMSIRICAPTKGSFATVDSRAWGMASAVKKIDEEDWSSWNRISLWVYPDLPGHKTVSFYLDIYNNADSLGKGGTRNRDNIILKNGQWNHVVSEIEHFERNKVTAVALRCRSHGHEEGSADKMVYYFDNLELQKVIPDWYKGWSVSPGKIAFCHVGYRPAATKVAIASKLPATRFSLIDANSGKRVLSAPICYMKNELGEFQLMDFSSFTVAGNYYIEAGEIKTQSFLIDDNVWQSPLQKVLNFFYVERCGYEIPGVHELCHVDWKGHGMGKTVSINGGWHDAGDLSQGLYNTAEITNNLFVLYERMLWSGVNDLFAEQVLSEAVWGLDWLLKTITDDNLRSVWAVNAWWSNNIIGDFDDVNSRLSVGSFERYITVSAQVTAARVLKAIDGEKAFKALQMAKRDWEFGLKTLDKQKEENDFCLSLSAAIIAGIELYQETKDVVYADKALELSLHLIEAQERAYIDNSDFISGFLYTNDTDKDILHAITPGSYELIQITALVKLCEAFPQHHLWMKWYSGVVLYSEFFHKRCVSFFEPYHLLPGGIYHIDDWEKGFKNNRNSNIKESEKELMKQMIAGGRKISPNYVVRAFPPSRTGFGTTHLNLAQTAALALSAHLRGNFELIKLGEKQLEWTLGCNPFTQSFMYGEGYDYVPIYNPMSGDIVGALPVGLGAIPSDEPYWPAGNNEPSKREQWVHTGARFVNLVSHITGPAIVEGKSSFCVSFKEVVTGKTTHAFPVNGAFKATLIPGEYQVTINGKERRGNYLPGTNYLLDPSIECQLTSKTGSEGEIYLEILLQGKGEHILEIRTENMTLPISKELTVNLIEGKTERIIFRGEKKDKRSPWFAVVIPNSNFSDKKELFEQLN